jgi:hypothetical protein
MKKILIPLLFLLSFPVFSQTGIGWVPYRTKMNIRDSSYFYKDAKFAVPARFMQSFKIGAVTISASGDEINILDGALVNKDELNKLVGIGNDTIATRAYARIHGGGGVGGLSAVDVANQIRDSINDLKNKSLPIGNLVWQKTDTGNTYKQVITFNQLHAYTGAGSGLNFYELKGKVGISQGFPVNGDSIIPHSAFANYSHLQFYKNGVLQWYNGYSGHNEAGPGYILDQEASEIITRPVLSTGDYVQIYAYAPILWHTLVPEGTGGSSPLTDSLYAYWRCNETEGPYITSEIGGYMGTGYDAGPGWAGKLGSGVRLHAVNSAITVPYNANLGTTGDKLTFSVWFKLDTLPSVSGVRYNLFTLWDNTLHIAHELAIAPDDKIWGMVINSTGTEYYAGSSGTVTTGSWHHAVLSCVGTGKALSVYLDNTQTTGNTFSGTLHSFNGNITIGNQQATYDKAVRGNMDEIGYWFQGATPADVSLLWNSSYCRTYPFNE